MTSGVPKFASFRPKPKPNSEPPKDSQPSESATRTSKKKEANDKPASSASERLKSDKDPSTSRLYFSDRRGDPDILRYGRSYRYDVPAYRRFGHGCVLGLPPNQKIDHELSSDGKIYITPAIRPRQERLLTSKHTAREGKRTLRVIKQGDDKIDGNEDFIAISAPHTRNDTDGEDEENALNVDYRGFSEQRSASQPADPELQYDSGTERVSAQTDVTRQNSKFVRRTRESPEEVQAWMDFIDHQETMISLEQSSVELSDSSRRQLADVRIPIYEEALKKIGNNPESQIQLYKGLFKEAQRSWNESKLTSKWNDVLQKYPKSTELWFMFLDYMQSSLVQSKYEACCTSFIRCLKAIQADAPVETTLHVFVRMTSMIHDAGYQELALAIWQAILEYHLLRPQAEKENFSFEDFWESEVPRIGESGAKGWREAVSDDVPPSCTETLQQSDPSIRPLDDFEAREMDSISKLRYPGRSSDEIADDDAFHTIFYSDIEGYSKLLQANIPELLIVEAFLCFCRLPRLPRCAAHQQAWWMDPFLLRISSPAKLGHISNHTDGFAEVLQNYAASFPRHIQMTSHLLFDQEFSLSSVRLGADFIRRLLKLLISSLPSEDTLGEYLLAFEVNHFPADVFKTAKQLLKSRPSSQRLYHAYGLVESRRGNSAKAAQVFSMALSMQKGNGAMQNLPSLKLISSWVWEALISEEPAVALWRLTSVTGNVSIGAPEKERPDHDALLVAQNALREACENALIHHDYSCAVTSTSLNALLVYLISDCRAEVALATHTNLSNWFKSNKLSNSPQAELHAQSIARFLTYHATHASIVKPALIRTALEPHITSFPSNTILLSLYATNEARFSINDRVRDIMYQTALKSSDATNIAGWTFAIHYETMRGQIAGTTSHSIRALYKRATKIDSMGAHCPTLWSSYLRFEIEQLHLERAKATGQKPRRDGKTRTWEARLEEAQARVKNTFYQGLQNLPWCKDFIMIVFTEAKGVFGDDELWKVYRVMQEKQLRVYVEIE